MPFPPSVDGLSYPQKEFILQAQVAAGIWAQSTYLKDRLRGIWKAMDTIVSPSVSDELRVLRQLCTAMATRIFEEPPQGHTFPSVPLLTRRELRVELALATIIERCSQCDLSLVFTARRVGLSSCHLSRLLTHETGEGYCGHVRRIRLMKSVLLMEVPQLILKEIALRAGFASTAELDRQFRRHFKVRPSDFLVAG